MREKRRKFTNEFKSEAVRLVVDTSRPIAEVAREIGVHESTLGNWVDKPRLSSVARIVSLAAAVLAVIAVGASRVLLGVHYPTDVGGGALLGTATALALVPILALPGGARPFETKPRPRSSS